MRRYRAKLFAMYIKISGYYYVIYIIFAFYSKKTLKNENLYAIMTKYSNFEAVEKMRL